MDLRKFARAMGKRWYLVLVGVVLGCCFVFLGMYKVTFKAPDSTGTPLSRVVLTKRSFKTYETVSAVLIDAPGAGLGRTDVPIERSIQLAPTYAYMATDDSVMRELESKYGRPLQAKVTAVAVEDSPIVQLTVQGKDPKLIEQVAATAQKAFMAELGTYQRINGIPSDLRIVVRPLGPPSLPELVVSREYEVWALLFLLPVVFFSSLALLMENWSRNADGSGASLLADSSVPGGHGDSAPAGEPAHLQGDSAVRGVTSSPQPVEVAAGQQEALSRGRMKWPWT